MVKQEPDSPPTTLAADGEGSTPTKTYPEPTAQEAYFFFNVIKNLKTKPEVDWDAVAVASGLKNGSTASVRFRQIKQKLGLDSGAGGRGTKKPGVAKAAGEPKTPARKRTRAKASPKTPKTDPSDTPDVKSEHAASPTTPTPLLSGLPNMMSVYAQARPEPATPGYDAMDPVPSFATEAFQYTGFDASAYMNDDARHDDRSI